MKANITLSALLQIAIATLLATSNKIDKSRIVIYYTAFSLVKSIASSAPLKNYTGKKIFSTYGKCTVHKHTLC